ncbi:MAG: peptidyl-prolyl cis-trans isomerase, partial [Prevotella sp.]|nr:peptidyl-prolyl cis-trans isomerase [Prevotella sp.]
NTIMLYAERGDKIKVRHILRKPIVSDEAVDRALARLDSIRMDIVDGKFSFEAGASVISDDKDTRNNHGLMANITQEGRTSRFKLAELPPEVAKAVDTLAVGAVSKPFTMFNERGKTVCAIAKLKSRVEGHKATVTEDFQVMKNLVLNKRRNQGLHDWVVKRIKSTYVRINDRYRDCQFEYEGWVR